MPQICRLLGYIIFFWSNENNEPVHVHVCKGKPHEDATKIWIEDEPRLEHNKLAANKNFVVDKWNKHFS